MRFFLYLLGNTKKAVDQPGSNEKRLTQLAETLLYSVGVELSLASEERTKKENLRTGSCSECSKTTFLSSKSKTDKCLSQKV